MRLPFLGERRSNTRSNDQHGDQQLHYPASNVTNISQQPLSNTPLSFLQLSSMSIEDLERATLDQSAFEALLTRVANDLKKKPGSGILDEVEALRRSNIELARANLAKESEIEEAKRHIAIIFSTDYQPAKLAFEEKYKRQEAAREHIAPERLILQLRDAAEQANREANDVLQKFRAGKMHVDDFIQQFCALKIKTHTRELKYKSALKTIPNALPIESTSPTSSFTIRHIV